MKIQGINIKTSTIDNNNYKIYYFDEKYSCMFLYTERIILLKGLKI